MALARFPKGFDQRQCGKSALVRRLASIAAMLVAGTSARGGEAGPQAPAVSSWPPPVLHFCAAHCMTWYLASDRGGYTDKQNAGSSEPFGIKIVTFNRHSVVLHRTDPPNQWFPQGLKATIAGNVSSEGGSLTDGRINWTFGQGGAYGIRLTWGHALDSIPGDDNFLPPVVMHFCAQHCTTLYLTLDRKGYLGTPKAPSIGPDGYGIRIARFSRDGVELERSDPPNQWFHQGLKAVITGDVSSAGNALINGKIHWIFGQGGIHDVRMSWGTGLNAIPGQDGPTNAQSQGLIEALLLLFMMMPDDDSGSATSSTPIYRNRCAGVYSVACGTERRKNPRD